MCDVARPLNVFGRVFNAGYRRLAAGTLVPNTEEDRRGFVSALFASLAPISGRIRALKQTDVRRYKLIKHSVNAALLTRGHGRGLRPVRAGGGRHRRPDLTPGLSRTGRACPAPP